jgi:kynurenine 3-monooxygenase
MSKVVIIGAGLAGSLLAIYLAKRGIGVDVYEARGDMRQEDTAAGRSINLALSDRGIAALREVGMDADILAEAVPMYGRMIHSISGETKMLPYSGRPGEYINSVSRSGLNIALMNEAGRYDGVQFVFNERCIEFDSASGEVTFASGRSRRADTVIATDGAGSAVRQSMENQLPHFEVSSVFLDHGYKELHIPPAKQGRVSGTDREAFAIEPNALHIWPRHQFMTIALPNSDGSFTCTLFLAKSVEPGVDVAFDRLADADSLHEFFEREFPDAVPLMPTLSEDFFANPTGELGTVKCRSWNVGGKALLLGDSAHAMVPFYGQGMNCAFEDVRVLDSLVDKHGREWETIYEEYARLRKPNTDAIADMAEENFYEMRDATADPVFQRKRELETKLEQTYPDYFSKYSMVTFREDLPYAVAKAKGNAQDRLLMEICSREGSVSEIDLNEVMERIRRLTESLPQGGDRTESTAKEKNF